MKRTLHIFAVAALTLATAACQKEQASNSGENTVTINFSASEIQTKTVFGEKTDNKYPTLWTENNAVAISYNLKATTPKKAQVTPSDDKKTAIFSIEIEKDDDAESHNFYAVSPYSAVTSIYPSYKDFKIEIPSSQTPGELTCDESAQIIAAKSESSTFESDITLSFSHITAYGNLSLDLTGLDAGTVKTISLTASQEISGTYFYYPESDKLQANNASKTITLTTDKVSDIFFACAPADLSGGSLDVTVTAENGTYEKSIDLTGKTLKFEAGKVSKFSVKGFSLNEEKGESLPFEDDFSWQTANTEKTINNNSDLKDLSSGKFIEQSYLYTSKTAGEIRIGTSKNPGSISTCSLDLSNAFYVEIEAKAYNTGDNAILNVTVGNEKKTAENALTDKDTYSTYYFNFSAATANSQVIISTSTKRAVITNIRIAEGTYIPAAKLSLTPEEATVDCDVTETSFNVSSNTSWTVSSDADWAKLTTDKGTGNAEVQITLDQNTGTTSRTAKFTVESDDKTITKSFTLTQNAFEPKLELDTDNATVLASATEATFKVISNTDWKVSTDSDWADCTEKGSNNGTVEISVKENTGEERTATFTVTTTDGSISKTFTLTQKAAGEEEELTATYTVASTTSVTASGNTPNGSNATFKNTYSTKEQMTKGKSQTYTLSGYNGKTIKKVVLSMKSNTKAGAGTFSLKAGNTTLASISSATTFDKWFDNTAYSSSYKDITVTLTEDNYEIKDGEDIVLVISATENSLYCKSITIIYQ